MAHTTGSPSHWHHLAAGKDLFDKRSDPIDVEKDRELERERGGVSETDGSSSLPAAVAFVSAECRVCRRRGWSHDER